MLVCMEMRQRDKAGVLSAVAYHHAVSAACSLGKLRPSNLPLAVCWKASMQQFKKRRCVMPFRASSTLVRFLMCQGLSFILFRGRGPRVHVTGEYCRQAKQIDRRLTPAI